MEANGVGSTEVTGVISTDYVRRGVSFPTIWYLVDNGLLEALNFEGCYA